MTDRELLEAAAKAAGYEAARVSDYGNGLLLVGDQEPFAPLTDDGDALRLAVKLRLDIEFQDVDGVECYRNCLHSGGGDRAAYRAAEYDSDINAATRRAIVRAAAAMAEVKP